MPHPVATDFAALLADIRTWGHELGFAEIGVADTELSVEEARLLAWLDAGRHGDMDYMARHGTRRARPAELVPGTLRVISARLDYLPPDARDSDTVLVDRNKAYISRYALGRDYHKVLRDRLQRLAERIAGAVGEFSYRVFTDSAPVLEVALAAKAGLGWRGKHTLLLTREAGSFFFLGEIYTDLPLPLTPSRDRPLRHLPRMSRCMPNRRDRCALRTRCAPLHLVPDHRAEGQHSGGLAPPDRQSRVRLRRLSDRLPVEQIRADERRYPTSSSATASTTPTSSRCSRGRRTNSTSACEAAPSVASATSGGCAIWRWASATRDYDEDVVAALTTRRDDPSTLVREHVAWALASNNAKAVAAR